MSVISYRTFRNTDPPRILALWNRSAQTRGFGVVLSCDKLEHLLFSKPIFDPKGLHLALDGDNIVGLCHAGFGCDERERQLDRSMGTIAMLMVDPDYRRQGIGTKLLHRGQQYLREHGANIQYAGGLFPLNPFYLGLYGGSELPGVLDTDQSMVAFLGKRNYTAADTCLVFQRTLEEIPTIEDPRLPLLWRQVELTAEPWPMPTSWWHASVMQSVVSLAYEMVERSTRRPIGHAWVWEMESFGLAWKMPTVGISQFEVAEPFRRQGYGKLFVHSILKHLRGQKINCVEVQTMERNQSARGLYAALGFQQVDTGHIYRLEDGTDTQTEINTDTFASVDIGERLKLPPSVN